MAARAARTAPHDFGHLVAALETTTDLVRPGYHLAQAEARIAEMNAGPLADWFHLGNPDVRFCYLSLANAHLYAGRLDEAIAERARVLEDSGGSWPNQTKVLVDWQTSTDILARCHAKEGFARGDLGRVLEGISLTRATTASEIAVSVRALLALGEPVLARLAFAHARPHGPRRHPAARLAGAEALMSCGELGAALSELFVVELRHPRQRYETQVHRTLRLGACLSLATWESEIQSLVDRGALRLGALAARHTADFVPGCAKSGVVLRALGAREAQDVPAAAIDALATALGVAKKAKTRLDRALDPGKESSLAAADAIATRFWDGLSKGAARDRELLYVATQALARYLVATTRAPSVLAGGYRQAAASAFEAIAARDPELDTGTLRAVLAALEEAGAGVDTWVFDAWILYVERALRIEDRVSGRLESLASGLSRVSASLRGDLAIGVELATAGRLEDSDPEAALALLERCVRAGCGSNVAFRAARAAEACRGPVDVLDRAWTALSSSPFAAAPAITVARRSFENGASDVAFAALCEHLSKGGATWREARVAELSEAWRASGLDVPLDFDEAQSAGLTALSSGDFEKARRCYAWCNALDPNNAVTLKNLGLVSTRLGKTADALAYFSQADAGAAPTWTAHELMASRKFAESMPAHRYAALGYDRAELFVYAAKSAWFAGDDEAKLAAVARARALDPASVDLTFLNGYADAAATFGDDEPCEEAARELLAKGAGNATWESLAHFHLATVLSRRGDFKQASRHAKDAARLNPLPDNAAEFADMVDRCKRKDPKKPTPKRADAPAAKAFACLLDDDAGAALALAGEATTGRLALARLTAARRRNEGEERVIVTDRALTAAREVVAATEGATTMEDASARVAALRILEDALGPVDPPPTLGKRMSREEFRKAYVARGGVDRRPAVLLP
jgi:tetratricopeptide (TPR) repeat protein